MLALWVLTIKRRLILGTLIAYGVAAVTATISIPNVAIELNSYVQIQTVELHKETTQILAYTSENTELTVEEKVRLYFDDMPIMAEVARCESQFAHINPITGTVIRGRVNPLDVGVMQINQYYHDSKAKSMGLDLIKFTDNLEYARYLYEREGTEPWNASKACWQNNLLAIR